MKTQSLGDLRPVTFEDFVGYENEKKFLSRMISVLSKDVEDVRRKNPQADEILVSTDHILVIGLPGCGKTTLAQIYAKKMAQEAFSKGWPVWADFNRSTGVEEWVGGTPNVPFRWATVEGRILKDASDINDYLRYMQDFGVLIIDEFQQVGEKAVEVLYSMMHDGKWYSQKDGKMLTSRGLTIIATTTDESEIPNAILSRFATQIRLNSYTKDDLTKIVNDTCKKIGIHCDDREISDLVAVRGRGIPREIISILKTARTILRGDGDSVLLTKDVVKEASIQKGYGPMGLTKGDARVMLSLREAMREGRKAIGAESLAIIAGYGTTKNYKKAAEFLVMMGYVVPSSRGTVLTEAGKKALSLAEEESDFSSIAPERNSR